MARKTLGKMEFANLIDTLKEQNQGQLEAQQETTKSIRNLQAYFLKQDRADARRRLEEQMEERADAEKVTQSGKSMTSGFKMPKRLPTKGLSGLLSNTLSTALLGAGGAAIFTKAFSALKFGSGFGMKFGRLFSAALFIPQLWESIEKGFTEYEKTGDLSDSIAKAATDYFAQDSVIKSMGLGALTGFTIAGPRGAVAGAILGGAVAALSGAFGQDGAEDLMSKILDYITSAPGALALTAAYAGSKLVKKGGKLAQIGKMGLRGGVAFLLLAPALDAVSDAMKPKEGEKGLGTKVKEFLFSDKQNGMSLLEAAGQGALIGFSVFGWKGAIVGAVVGGAYDIVDDAIRENRAKRGKEGGLFAMLGDWLDKTYNRFSDMFTMIFGSEEEKNEVFAKQQTLEKKTERYKSFRRNFLFELTQGTEAMNNAMANLKEAEKGQDLTQEQKTKNRVSAKMGVIKTATTGTEFENLVKLDPNSGEFSFDLKSLRALDKNSMEKLFNIMRGSSFKDKSMLARSAGQVPRAMFNVQMMQKEMGEIEAGKYTKEVPITENARGAQVYRKPTLALVAEKPGTAEYIMSDTNLARLADTIATQRENQTMNTMIPIMMGQGGGASMPVINNSYSYQNTENSVREMPTTSSLNMMTALA